QAKRARCALVTACGYDFVPGNLAAGLALREAGADARSVQVGYFVSGPSRPSGGTAVTAAGFVLEPTFGFRDGRLVAERNARSVASFDVNGRSRDAFSIGGTEHFSLP